MTDKFDRAVQIVLKHEGGLVNDSRDAGGLTNHGISQRQYPHLDIRNLTVGQAKAIYRRDYWDRFRCGEMPWPIAMYLFDCVVNHNPINPVRWMQRVLGVKQDAIIGPITIGAANRSDAKAVAREMCKDRLDYVRGLSNFDRFGRGWINRYVDVLYEALKEDI